jgi:hypothetical protein
VVVVVGQFKLTTHARRGLDLDALGGGLQRCQDGCEPVLMTMVTLRSVTHILETELAATEFAVLPIFGRDGQPAYQIRNSSGRRRS